MPFALYLLYLGASKLSSWNLEYIATIEVALRAGNSIHRPTIVDESYSSHDKEKEQCLYTGVGSRGGRGGLQPP